MSDYMFKLESHLSTDQFRVVGQMQAVASAAGVNLFLTGGAMRDMLGGFPVRDLDFTVEGSPQKLAKILTQKHDATLVSTDEHRKSVEMRFPGGVRVELAMARTERFSKSGARPQVTQATIHEDLRGRDFTVNAIALSLNKASMGLPIDPTNGVGDIERKELRTIHNYSFYDDPVRMLRLIRFKVRLGYSIDERTRMQYDNAREAEMLTKIAPEALGDELRHMASEPLSADLMRTLEEEKLTELYSSSLTGAKLNLANFTKLQKARQMVPFGTDLKMHSMPLFLSVLMENLNAKDRTALIKNAALERSEVSAWQKLEGVAKKLERELKADKLKKASQLYQVLIKAPGEQVLWLMVYSAQRLVQDRIRNYFEKYLPMSQEVTDEMVAAAGVAPGTAKFQKTKDEMILKHLDARPKKVEPPPEPPPPPPMSSFARGPGVRHAR
jgi:tRNA nucleotidyltransferase/poly(A) polymerase